jgi:uncharacterized protein
VKIIRKADIQTSRWAGGTTSQLFIFPAGSDYKKMDFDFRISTATIETETSTFTSLPGVKRILMVLDGTLELSHRDQLDSRSGRSTILEPFETDSFPGDWETTSGGKVTDFNLMIRRQELEGMVRMMQLGKKSDLVLEAEHHAFIYLHKGEVMINEKESLQRGDGIYFDSSSPLRIQGKANTELIYVTVK